MFNSFHKKTFHLGRKKTLGLQTMRLTRLKKQLCSQVYFIPTSSLSDETSCADSPITLDFEASLVWVIAAWWIGIWCAYHLISYQTIPLLIWRLTFVEFDPNKMAELLRCRICVVLLILPDILPIQSRCTFEMISVLPLSVARRGLCEDLSSSCQYGMTMFCVVFFTSPPKMLTRTGVKANGDYFVH